MVLQLFLYFPMYVCTYMFKIPKEQCVQSFDQKCEDEYHVVERTEYKVSKQFGA